MNFSEYFEMGRQNERQHREKAQARKAVRSVKKPSAFSPAGIIIGAGVLYEMLFPIISRFRKNPKEGEKRKPGFFAVVKYDIASLIHKIRGNAKWEEYQRFEELARGKR